MNIHFLNLVLRIGLGWFLFVAAGQALAAPLVCDANNDQVIDSRDITLIATVASR